MIVSEGSDQLASMCQRWLGSLWDLLPIMCWVLALATIGVSGRAWLPSPGSTPSPLLTDAIVFALIVLPVWGYLTATEGGDHQGTWGKRRTHTRVVTSMGRRPRLPQIMIRNAVKLLPWQLAHVAVVRIILEVDAPVVIGLTYVLSLAIPVLSMAMAWRDPLHRAMHDRAARTRVIRA